MYAQVPKGTWDLDALEDRARRTRLLNPRAPAELLAAAVTEASRASCDGRMKLEWEPSRDWPGCYRIVATIPVSKLLFDELFNGRSGYRAQYYLSVEQGDRYNRAFVEDLSPALQEPHGRLSGCDGPSTPLAQSLGGGSSKIWMPEDEEVLKAAPAALCPPRWREYWQNREGAWGLRAPLPPLPQIDLKGSFMRPGSDEEFPTKPDRGRHIHGEGWPR
jgi:hypothetical protein